MPFGFCIIRRSTVDRHARAIADTLHAAHKGGRKALDAHHAALADAAEAMGLDLAALSGGGPKPPRGGDD
jgi:hypothetical protein